MSDNVFHWRGLTFEMFEEDPDYWLSGRGSLHRSITSKTLKWVATWRYSNYRWESAFDPERPWDRLTSLETLLKALLKRKERYPPDKGTLELQLAELETEERELLRDIEKRENHVKEVQEGGSEAK